jgi:hypothetical protein
MGEDEAILALNMHLCASETESLADTLKQVCFGGSAQYRLIGRVSKTHLLALLVPRGIALAEINAHRKKPISDAELRRVLADNHILDYPGGTSQASDAYVSPLPPEGLNGPNPEALQGDDYPLEYDKNGYPELPACLDCRKPKMTAQAA